MAKFNLFATTSNTGFLKCIKAPDGQVFVGNDINSLEPHVLAHFSQDPGYLKIYGKGQAPNCIYLYFGAHSPTHGHMFREVYDPYNSTAEQVDVAKEKYGDERQRYKVGVLTLQYEGTEKALDRQFNKYGISTTLGERMGLVKLFKKTFHGLPSFRQQLFQEWYQNNGYILTGAGRPLAIPRDKIKEFGAHTDALLAYFCQSTGHDFVLRWLYHMNCIRHERKLKCKPKIPDFHDATYWACPDNDKDIDATQRMMYDAYDRLNEELDLSVEFKGKCKVGKTLEIK